MVLHRKGTIDERETFYGKKLKLNGDIFPIFLQSFLLDNISNFFLNLLWSVVMVACNYMV